MDSGLDFHDLRALLEWQVELGVTEAIGDVALNRYQAVGAAPVADAGVALPAPGVALVSLVQAPGGADRVALARELAAGAGDLAGLRAAMARFDGCDLKNGARSLVFGGGNPLARVMVIGEAPGRDEDQAGLPFVGPAGVLLDRMFAAIGLARGAPDRDAALYLTTVLPWRPPQDRDPSPDEIALLMPFVARHVALVDPKVIVVLGNTACAGVLGQKGIARLRGQWAHALGKPVLPMLAPAYLLRNPAAKRAAWADLLALQARLRGAHDR